MANLGDIRISTDYQVLKQGPMDARLKKKTKSDLINPESWASSGSDVYVYPTMLVGIEDSGEIYKLLSVENIFAEDYSGWELLGSNASAAPEIYIGSEEPTDENVVVWYDPNDNIEDPWIVDSELNESSSNPIANAAVTVKINELQNTQSEIETSLSEKLSETAADSKYQPKGDYLTAEDLPEMPELATVATTGSYEDLSNKPTFKTINNQEITGEGNIEIEVASDIVVDSEILDTSENPVQNKVIKEYVDSSVNNINLPIVNSLESTETTSALSANQGKVLKELVDGKMDSTTFKTINGNEITGEGDIDTNQKYTIYFTTEEGSDLTDEQKASNKVIYDLAVEGKAPMWCYSMNNELPLQFYGMQTESDITYAAYVYDQIVSKTDEKSENVYLLVGIKEDGDIYTNGTFGYNILHEDAVLNAINGGSTSDVEIREIYTGNSEEEKQYNIETIALVKQDKAIPVVRDTGSAQSGIYTPYVTIIDDTLSLTLNPWINIAGINFYITSEILVNADGSVTMSQNSLISRMFNDKMFVAVNDVDECKSFINNFDIQDIYTALSIPVRRGDSEYHFPLYFKVGGTERELEVQYISGGNLYVFAYDAAGNQVDVELKSLGPGYILSSAVSPATLELKPNYFYRVSVSGDTVITLTDTADDLTTKEYVMKIVCTGTPNITLPDGLAWANDTAPVFTAGKTYMISIIDNLAVFAEFTTAS